MLSRHLCTYTLAHTVYLCTYSGALPVGAYALTPLHIRYTSVRTQELFRYLSETRPYETYVVTLPEGRS